MSETFRRIGDRAKGKLIDLEENERLFRCAMRWKICPQCGDELTQKAEKYGKEALRGEWVCKQPGCDFICTKEFISVCS